MKAKDLFDLIRRSINLKPGCIRDNGTVSIARWGNDLISIAVWGGEDKTRRLELVYSTAMNLEYDVSNEDWLPLVLEACTWEQSRKGMRQ